MTQNERILEHLKTHKGITSLEAISNYGCTRLSARIADIKAMGYPVGRVMVDAKNRFGETVKVAQYFLARGNNED